VQNLHSHFRFIMVDKELLAYLTEFLTEPRKEQLNRVLSQRTHYITVVLEDIYQSQNASAVVRSCDCFGIQQLHIIENRNTFNINPDVVMGSSKWVDIKRHNNNENNTLETLRQLKREGYRVVATSPHENDVMLDDFDLSQGKFALVFGTEQMGISDIVKAEADAFLKIPMVGFTESFNISVSVAICLHHLSEKLRRSSIHWQLTDEELLSIKYQWVKKCIRRPKLIIDRFYRDRHSE
jgi:tRNA (guanosine-2'-O-)-methyltransferase